MGWEFRLFFPLAPATSTQDLSVPNTGGSRTAAPDVFEAWGIPPPDQDGLEVRTDVYLLTGDEAVGIKFRNVDAAREAPLEVKLRKETKRRLAECWTKRACRGQRAGGDVDRTFGAEADVLRRAVCGTAAAAMVSDAKVCVRVTKQRWQGMATPGAFTEQTDLQVEVILPGHGDGPECCLLPGRYRTICFEGEPKHCYALAGRLLRLPANWELRDLRNALKAISGDASSGCIPAMAGGYPRFVEAAGATAARRPAAVELPLQ